MYLLLRGYCTLKKRNKPSLCSIIKSIMAKHAKSKEDKALIAYNGVKLRIVFYILTICTIAIFIGLPISSYIWTL